MKKIFIVVLALFFINFPILYCDASTEETIQEQQSEFQIQDFIKNAKQYSGEFFERGLPGEFPVGREMSWQCLL